MPELHNSSELKPLLVSVRDARKLLGGIGHNTFWKLAREGAFEIVGSSRKRFVVVTSIERYVAEVPRVSRGPTPTPS
jgi:hypothetical protein